VRVAPRETDPIEEVEVSPIPVLIGMALAVVVGLRLNAPLTVMIVAIAVMMLLHELGHFLTAKWGGMKVTQFFLGFGPRLWSFRRGETEYGVRAIPAGAFVTVIGMSNLEDVDPADEPRTYRAKPYWRRMSVAVAGSTMHLLIALTLIFIVLAGFGRQDPGTDRWIVATVSKPSGAYDAGLRPGDRIVAVDGNRFDDFEATSDYLRAHPGAHVVLDVDRHGEAVELEATLGRENPRTGAHVGFLGVGPDFPFERMNPVAAVPESFRESWRVAKGSVAGLAHIFSPEGVKGYVDTIAHPDDKDGNAVISENRPTSIVGIAQIGSQIAANGYVNVLYLLFGVNIFIAIFNLLPILPFDGGHVAIATYEKIRSMISGRRYEADVAKLLPLTYLVVLALALLFVTSMYLDIAHPVKLE
jgi:membrane-associated protease RseP (regulator of RpoE activity)